jgi:hypothetical protein
MDFTVEMDTTGKGQVIFKTVQWKLSQLKHKSKKNEKEKRDQSMKNLWNNNLQSNIHALEL